jgi:hypothetical protein
MRHEIYVVCSYWLDQLYTALYPEYYILGCRADLDSSVLEGALPILRDWLQHQLYAAHTHAHERFLASVMIAGTLIFTLDRDRAASYVNRAPCLIKRIHPVFSRNGGVYIIGDLVEHLAGGECDSITRGVFFLGCGRSSTLIEFSFDVGGCLKPSRPSKPPDQRKCLVRLR